MIAIVLILFLFFGCHLPFVFVTSSEREEVRRGGMEPHSVSYPVFLFLPSLAQTYSEDVLNLFSRLFSFHLILFLFCFVW